MDLYTNQDLDPLLNKIWDIQRDGVNIRTFQMGEKTYVYHIPTNSVIDSCSPVGALLLKITSGQITSIEQFNEADFEASKQLWALRGIERATLDDSHLPISYLAVSPTLNCNLRCTYCYNFQEAPEEKVRKINQLEKPAISKIFNTLSELNVGERINLAFIGGEPFLHPHLLDKLARFARTKAKQFEKKLILLVTTNGLNLGTQSVKQAILRNDLRVSISIDGPPAWHNQNRKLLNGTDSFSTIQRNIEKFFDYYPHNIRAARATYKLLPGRLLTTYRFLRDSGFNDISTGSHEFETGDIDRFARDELMEEVDNLASEIEQDFISGRLLRHAWFTEVISNLHHGRVKDVVCGATRNHVAFDIYGKMQACHRYLGNEEYELSADDITSSLKSLRVVDIRSFGKTAHCSKCWARSLCGGECFHVGKEIAKQSNHDERQQFLCDYKRKKYEAALRIFIRLSENYPSVLSRVVNPILSN